MCITEMFKAALLLPLNNHVQTGNDGFEMNSLAPVIL